VVLQSQETGHENILSVNVAEDAWERMSLLLALNFHTQPKGPFLHGGWVRQLSARSIL